MSSANIPVFLTYIRSEFLYSHKQGFGYFEDATPFAITSIPNGYLKLNIISNNMAFNQIPLSGITNSKTSSELSEDECNFHNCILGSIFIVKYEHLDTISNCSVWKKDNSLWQLGTYVFTICWENGEELHIIELEDGNYIAWANSHIVWGDEVPEGLPEYGDS